MTFTGATDSWLSCWLKKILWARGRATFLGQEVKRALSESPDRHTLSSHNISIFVKIFSNIFQGDSATFAITLYGWSGGTA
jgi:hypothetical protein